MSCEAVAVHVEKRVWVFGGFLLIFFAVSFWVGLRQSRYEAYQEGRWERIAGRLDQAERRLGELLSAKDASKDAWDVIPVLQGMQMSLRDMVAQDEAKFSKQIAEHDAQQKELGQAVDKLIGITNRLDDSVRTLRDKRR